LLAVELLASVDIITPGNAPVETKVPPNWPHPLCSKLSDWLPGDIVLFRSGRQLKDTAIVLAQACSFSPVSRAGCHFVHAAIYVGEGDIVDITASGVAKRSIWTYCEHHATTVRRYTGLDTLERNNIVQFALSLVSQGHAYSWSQLVGLTLIPGTGPQTDGLYCSTLVGLTYQKAAGVQLHAR
jgi:cell wall-associated NlpC family hydrolase